VIYERDRTSIVRWNKDYHRHVSRLLGKLSRWYGSTGM